MITRNGVEILSKYLAGHTSSYASHIAIGCGARPYYTSVSSVNYNANSNSNPDFKGYTGTVSAVTGTGPWTVTVTSLPDVEKISVGDILLSWQGTATGGAIVSQPKNYFTGLTGTVGGTATTTTVTLTGSQTTAGLYSGMTVTETGTNTGSFGGVTTITGIPNSTQITITSTSPNTAGAITFSALESTVPYSPAEMGGVPYSPAGASTGLKNVVVASVTPSTNTITLTVTGGTVAPTTGNVEKMYFAPSGYAGTVDTVTGTGPWTVAATLTTGDVSTLSVGQNITRFIAGAGAVWNGNPTSVVISTIDTDTNEFTYVQTGGSAPTVGTFTKMVTGVVLESPTRLISASTGPGPYYDYVSIVAKPELQSLNHIMPGDYINVYGSAGDRKVIKFVNKLSVIISGNTSLFVYSVPDNSGIQPINTTINNFTKNELDFEMDRFKVNSISYVSNYKPLYISSASIERLSNIVTFSLGTHGLKIGDKFSVKGIKNLSGNIDLNVASESDYYYVDSVPSTTTVTARMNQVATTTHTYNGTSTEIDALTSATVYSSEISLLAELPGINKYEITEIGLYSQGSDAYNSGSESRTILDFSQPEKWQYFDAATNVEKFSDLLYYPSIGDVNNNMTPSLKAFYCNAEDSFFTDTTYTDRKARFERPRFGNDAIVVAGDMSDFEIVSGKKVPTATSNFIETNLSANFSKNAATDKLKLALSVINKPYTVTTNPEAFYVMVQFLTSSGNDYANVLFAETDEYYVLSGNRYSVLSATLGDATKTSGFSWNDVSSVRVYASVENKTDTTGTVLSEFAIILDGLRFENVNNTNPQYGLIGYSPVTSDSIIKKSNTSNIIEFRFDIGVGI